MEATLFLHTPQNSGRTLLPGLGQHSTWRLLRKWYRSLLVVLLLVSSSATFAAELEYVEVSSKKKRFFVDSKAVLQASIDDVYDTLIDFDNYENFSSIYHDAKWLTQNLDGTGEIFTYTRGCIAFFCKGFARVETVKVMRPTSIITEVDPKRSQAVYGRSSWLLEDNGDNTTVTFNMSFQPDFWVPPVVGPYFIKRMLRDNGGEALERIENLAIARRMAEDVEAQQ